MTMLRSLWGLAKIWLARASGGVVFPVLGGPGAVMRCGDVDREVVHDDGVA